MLLLVQVIAAGEAVGVDVRLAAAVNFKNTVKYRWVSRLRPPAAWQQHGSALAEVLKFLQLQLQPQPAAGAHRAGRGFRDAAYTRPREGWFFRVSNDHLRLAVYAVGVPVLAAPCLSLLLEVLNPAP